MSRKIGVILTYIQMIFNVLSTLLLTPFIISTLGQAEYGVFKLSAAITAYLLLLDLGVGNAVIRYISKYRAENDFIKQRQFLGVASIFYFIISIITLIIGYVLIQSFPVMFAKGLNTSEVVLGQKLLVFTILNCAFTLLTTCYDYIIIAYEKFKVSRVCSIASIIIRMLFTYIVLKLGFGSVGIVVVNLAVTILSRIYLMGYVFIKIKLFPLFKNIEFDFIKEIVMYSSLILIQMIATQINANVDQILLGSFVVSSAVIIGVYGIGTQIVQYFQQIGSAFTSVLMPGIVKMVENGVNSLQLTNEMIRIGRLIFMVLSIIWGCFLINGENFIILWAGKANAEAYYVAIILMFAYTFILTESIGTQILWALNQHKEQSYLKMAIVLVNIVLTILLIQWNPLIGATIGTFISLMAGDIGVMNYIFKKKLRINLLDYYKNLFKGIIPSLVIAVAAGYLCKMCFSFTWFGFIIKVLIMCMIYAICMFMFGMTKYEKQLLLSFLKKF